jgi:hypothetical protein
MLLKPQIPVRRSTMRLARVGVRLEIPLAHRRARAPSTGCAVRRAPPLLICVIAQLTAGCRLLDGSNDIPFAQLNPAIRPAPAPDTSGEAEGIQGWEMFGSSAAPWKLPRRGRALVFSSLCGPLRLRWRPQIRRQNSNSPKISPFSPVWWRILACFWTHFQEH